MLWFRLGWLLLLAWFTSPLPAAQNGHAAPVTELTLGVVPQFPLAEIHGSWKPVLDEIANRSSLRITLKPYASIPAFEQGFLNGEMDLAYLNPYHVLMAHKAAGYLPLLRDAKQRLAGILVVRKTAPIHTLQQLQEATIAFPAPNAFGASLYMRALLTRQEGLHFKAVYVKTHSNVYRHVLSGKALAGGGIQSSFDKEPVEVQQQLRILFQTPKVYAHPVVIHPRIPVTTRQMLLQAFITLAHQSRGKMLLQGIQMPEPVPASLQEYAPLARLGLEQFVQLDGDR